MARAVVLHPGALGDVLLAIPALRALRAGAPHGEIVLAAQPRIGRLLSTLSLVTRAVGFDDLGIDALFTDAPVPERLRRLLAGARVVSWFGARDPDFARRLRALAPGAVVASSSPPPGNDVWSTLLASLSPLGTRARRASLSPLGTRARRASLSPLGTRARRDPVALAPPLLGDGRRALAAAGWDGARPLVMLHPGAGSPAKCWPAEGFATVAERLVAASAVDVVVHEGPADRDAVRALLACARVPLLRLADPPLEILAGALRHVALWVGNDSGVGHLAAAVGGPALVLFAEANLPWRPWALTARWRVVGMGPLSPADVERVTADALSTLRVATTGALPGACPGDSEERHGFAGTSRADEWSDRPKSVRRERRDLSGRVDEAR